METISFEAKIAKHKSIRITLTGSNIGRPRDYMYFVGTEDAKAFANTLEAAVAGAFIQSALTFFMIYII